MSDDRYQLSESSDFRFNVLSSTVLAVRDVLCPAPVADSFIPPSNCGSAGPVASQLSEFLNTLHLASSTRCPSSFTYRACA